MKTGFGTKLAAGLATLAIGVTPAMAGQPTDPGSNGHHGEGNSGQAKAYGKYCADQSRKHVAGEKGTPFSQCVTAMAHLAKDKADNPREACASLSKGHVEGVKGTPFSNCVTGGKQLEAELSS